jgi:hypothetical protein
MHRAGVLATSQFLLFSFQTGLELNMKGNRFYFKDF